MNLAEIERRIEKLERDVDEIHRRRWDDSYPIGHEDREAQKPRWLVRREKKSEGAS